MEMEINDSDDEHPWANFPAEIFTDLQEQDSDDAQDEPIHSVASSHLDERAPELEDGSSDTNPPPLVDSSGSEDDKDENGNPRSSKPTTPTPTQTEDSESDTDEDDDFDNFLKEFWDEIQSATKSPKTPNTSKGTGTSNNARGSKEEEHLEADDEKEEGKERHEKRQKEKASSSTLAPDAETNSDSVVYIEMKAPDHISISSASPKHGDRITIDHIDITRIITMQKGLYDETMATIILDPSTGWTDPYPADTLSIQNIRQELDEFIGPQEQSPPQIIHTDNFKEIS